MPGKTLTFSTRLAQPEPGANSFERTYEVPPQEYSKSFTDKATLRWFHIIGYEPLFRGGKEYTFSRADIDGIVDVFAERKTPLSLDYDHASVTAADRTEPTETAGLLLGLGIRSDGLWGLGMFTERATELIKSGSYQWCSPVVLYGKEDARTGKMVPIQLFNCALTVNPAQDGLDPIKLSKDSQMEDKKDKTNTDSTKEPVDDAPANKEPVVEPDAVKPEDAPPDEQKKEPAGDGAILQTLCEAVGCASVAELIPLIEKNMDKVTAILKGSDIEVLNAGHADEAPKIKAAENTMADQKTDKLDKLEDVKDDQIAILSKQIEILSAKLETIDAERAQRAAAEKNEKIDKKVNDLLVAGKLTKDIEESARKLFAKDWDTAEILFSKTLVPVGVAQSGPAPTNPVSEMAKLDKLGKEMYESFKRSFPNKDEKSLMEMVKKTQESKLLAR